MRLRRDERERPRLAPDAVRQAVQDVLGPDDRVAAVVLFGSYAQGRVRGISDVDIGVVLKRGAAPAGPSWEVAGVWSEDLSRRLGGYPVDVVVLNDAPLLLRHNVNGEAQVLLEAEPGAWFQFWRRTVSEWRDRAPVRERFWQRFLDRWDREGFGGPRSDHPTPSEGRSGSV